MGEIANLSKKGRVGCLQHATDPAGYVCHVSVVTAQATVADGDVLATRGVLDIDLLAASVALVRALPDISPENIF